MSSSPSPNYTRPYVLPSRPHHRYYRLTSSPAQRSSSPHLSQHQHQRLRSKAGTSSLASHRKLAPSFPAQSLITTQPSVMPCQSQHPKQLQKQYLNPPLSRYPRPCQSLFHSQPQSLSLSPILPLTQIPKPTPIGGTQSQPIIILIPSRPAGQNGLSKRETPCPRLHLRPHPSRFRIPSLSQATRTPHTPLIHPTPAIQITPGSAISLITPKSLHVQWRSYVTMALIIDWFAGMIESRKINRGRRLLSFTIGAGTPQYSGSSIDLFSVSSGFHYLLSLTMCVSYGSPSVSLEISLPYWVGR